MCDQNVVYQAWLSASSVRVPRAQPDAEAGRAQVAVAGAAVLVADVPGDHGGMVGVPLGDAAGELGRQPPEDRRAGAGVVPLAVHVPAALEVGAA